MVLAKLLFRLFTLQQDCSRRSVVHRCKSCFSCFPYSAGSIEEFRSTLSHVVKVVWVVFPTQQAASKQRKQPWHAIFRMNHFPHFSCDRFLIDCPWFFFSTCVFVKKISSNRGETLILMYHFRSQFCGLKTGKWGLRDLFYPIFFGFYQLSYRLCCRI